MQFKREETINREGWSETLLQAARSELEGLSSPERARDVSKVLERLSTELGQLKEDGRIMCQGSSPLQCDRGFSTVERIDPKLGALSAPREHLLRQRVTAYSLSDRSILLLNHGSLELFEQQPSGAWLEQVVWSQMEVPPARSIDIGRISRHPTGGIVLGAPGVFRAAGTEQTRGEVFLVRNDAGNRLARVKISDEGDVNSFAVMPTGEVALAVSGRSAVIVGPLSGGTWSITDTLPSGELQSIRYAGRGRLLSSDSEHGVTMWSKRGSVWEPSSILGKGYMGGNIVALPDGTVAVASRLCGEGLELFRPVGERGNWERVGCLFLGHDALITGIEPLWGAQMLLTLASGQVAVAWRSDPETWRVNELYRGASPVTGAHVSDSGRIIVSGFKLELDDPYDHVPDPPYQAHPWFEILEGTCERKGRAFSMSHQPF